jgi:hypothetical protein
MDTWEPMFPNDCEPAEPFAKARHYTPLVIFLVQTSGDLRSHSIRDRYMFSQTRSAPFAFLLLASALNSLSNTAQKYWNFRNLQNSSEIGVQLRQFNGSVHNTLKSRN